MINVIKIYVGVSSLVKVFSARLITGWKIKTSLINSIRGKFRVEIVGNGNITIDRFLMSRGPLYIKSVQLGTINIGEKVFFNHNCSLTAVDNISIGNHCMFANNLVIVDHDHIVDGKGVTGRLISKPVVIGDNVWCGANVTITKGVHIGTGAIIAAGAVVTKDVPAKSVAMGVPAKIVRRM